MELENLSAEASGALCCATSLRIGGALYILAEAAGLEDAYYRADAGIRANMRAYSGRGLNSSIPEDGLAACRDLSAAFPLENPDSDFFRAGLGVVKLGLGAVLQEIHQSLVAEVFQKTSHAVSTWQAAADEGLEEYELSCQESSILAVRTQGIAALRKAAGEGALRYRRAAQSALSSRD